MKLTVEQLRKLEEQGRVREINPRPTKFWSLDDLAKGRMFSQSFIKKCVANVTRRKQAHRLAGWNGWTRNKTMRSEARIPIHLYLQPEFQRKYFPEQADEHEKVKALEALKRDFPAFRTHD